MRQAAGRVFCVRSNDSSRRKIVAVDQVVASDVGLWLEDGEMCVRVEAGAGVVCSLCLSLGMRLGKATAGSAAGLARSANVTWQSGSCCARSCWMRRLTG